MAAPTAHRRGRTTLAARHERVVSAMIDAFFTENNVAIGAVRLAEITIEVDRFISPASRMLRFGLLVTLDSIRVLVPLLLMRKLSLFDDLPREARVETLKRMDESRVTLFALLLVAWKTILTTVYFESPEGLRSLGYWGPERYRHRHLTRETHEKTR